MNDTRIYLACGCVNDKFDLTRECAQQESALLCAFADAHLGDDGHLCVNKKWSLSSSDIKANQNNLRAFYRKADILDCDRGHNRINISFTQITQNTGTTHVNFIYGAL